MKRMMVLALAALRVVAAAEAPVKVVSLSPAVTKMILALDGGTQLVGRSSACDQAAAERTPVVGDLGRPFVEPVLKSGAKFVLTDMAAPGPQWDMLKRCGVRVVLLPARTMDDLPDNVAEVGRILGRARAGDRLAGELRAKLEQLRRHPVRRRMRALVVLGLPPVVSCGRGSFVTDALALAGLDNIAAGAAENYFVLSTEVIHAADPEVIVSFVPEASARKYFSRGEYRNLAAVKAGRFLFPAIEDICRLTPRMPAALEALRSQLERDFPQQTAEKAVEFRH
ncbi:MAG: ABC transporter substrate-binding protein [Lentisphaeria bacterium]|nr:ABC transporter substrate-binding protein [Lentisphaeria bacterium]